MPILLVIIEVLSQHKCSQLFCAARIKDKKNNFKREWAAKFSENEAINTACVRCIGAQQAWELEQIV